MRLTRALFGATRKVMTGKDGNKNFYKGRGVKTPGFHTKFGSFRVVPKKIQQIMVPDLTGFDMKPYVSYRVELFTVEPLTPEKLLADIKTNFYKIEHKEIP